MGDGRSFAEILREKMLENNDFSEGKPSFPRGKKLFSQAENPDFPSEKAGRILLESLFSTAETSHFRSEKRHFSLYRDEFSKFKPAEPILKKPAAPVEKPKRQPRQWSESQRKALTLMIGFGAKLDDCSTDLEIKKAFRALAKKFHPDTMKGTNQSGTFIEIHQCYKTLLNAQ